MESKKWYWERPYYIKSSGDGSIYNDKNEVKDIISQDGNKFNVLFKNGFTKWYPKEDLMMNCHKILAIFNEMKIMKINLNLIHNNIKFINLKYVNKHSPN